MSVATTTSTDAARKRLEKELNNLRPNPLDGCSAHPKDKTFFEWMGTIHGPQASPYAGGIFNLVIHFTQDYPLKPPTVTFTTKIYHPNIDSGSGFVGLNILDKDWSPALTVLHIIQSLSAFLANPDPENAVVPDIAHEY
jgi:ubiquitin-conjugating enzyme E2 D/E